jgi:hypothetical protein
MRRSYVVPMRWIVIYEYEVPGGALNLSSTKLPRPWSPWGSSPWQNRESNPGPHDRWSETLTTRPRGWSGSKVGIAKVGKCLYDMICVCVCVCVYIYIFNCNWVDTRWQ